MAHPPELRARLRTEYIGGLPLGEAADKVGVPEATARKWYRSAKSEGDDWDRFQRASLIVAGGGIEQALGRIIASGLMRCEALVDKISQAEDPMLAADALASLGDTVSKLRAAARGMMPETDRLAVENDAIKAFSELLIRLYPKIGDQVVAALEAWSTGKR